MINPARGEFEAAIAGQPLAFDTRLGTIATIEARCGDQSIVAIVNRVVFGRRAADQAGLIAAALVATGVPAEDAETRAGRATVAEAERFILALMGALGFEVAPTAEAKDSDPLGRERGGDAGAPSRSAP